MLECIVDHGPGDFLTGDSVLATLNIQTEFFQALRIRRLQSLGEWRDIGAVHTRLLGFISLAAVWRR